MNKLQHVTRGGQVFFHNLRMLVQVNKLIGRWMLGLFLLVFLVCAFLIVPKTVLMNTVQYYMAYFWRLIRLPHHLTTIHFEGQSMHITASDILQQPYFQVVSHHLWYLFAICAAISFVVMSIGSYVSMRWLTKKGRLASEDQYLRGARLASVKEVNALITTSSAFTLDQLHFPLHFERQHILIHGTTGSGKSVAMLKQLLQVRRQGHKAALSDVSGAFLARLYQSGDIILNPFDTRSVQWDMWEDCPDSEALYQLASYLIPHHPRAEPIWVNAPRQIFVATAEKMRGDTDRSYTALLRIMLSMPMKEYTAYF